MRVVSGWSCSPEQTLRHFYAENLFHQSGLFEGHLSSIEEGITLWWTIKLKEIDSKGMTGYCVNQDWQMCREWQ
jgi:hypothetical protein